MVIKSFLVMLNMFKQISFKARIFLGFLSVISFMIVIVAVALVNFTRTQHDVAKVDENLLPNALLAERMGTYTVQVQQFYTQASISQDPENFQDAKRAAEDFKQSLAQLRKALDEENILTPAGKNDATTLSNASSAAAKLKELAALETGFDWYYNEGQRMTTVYAGESAEAGNRVIKDFNKLAKNLRSQLNRIKNQAVNDAKNNAHAINEATQKATKIMLAVSLAGIILGLGIAVYLTRYLVITLGTDPSIAKDIAKDIATGNLSLDIDVTPKDDSSLLFEMKHMQQQLRVRVTEQLKANEENTRLKMALDNISVNVMVADVERNIIYMNPAILNMMQVAEADIKKSILHFDVNKLMGSNIDIFHKNPAHQKDLLALLNKTFKSEINVAGRTFYLVANPIVNDEGQKLGTVVEWLDRTAEVSIEQDVTNVVNLAVTGDFSHQITEKGKQGFSLLLAQSINRLLATNATSLADLVRVLNALSTGDLTKNISKDYAGTYGELKDCANATVINLRNLIGEIKEVTDNINTCAKEIASGNNDLSHRTEQQGASLEETAASVEELTSTVQHNATNAKQANQLAVDASNIAEKGVEVVGQVVLTMDDINTSSRKIGDIISVIDDIAFQTNILALNAAVEAARAGEQGRGFAVVAVEVRNLAQRAATAAGEIKHLIDDSVVKVSEGSKLVTKAGQTMTEIVNSISGVTVMMSEISAASTEQTAGIQQVNQAIGQMDDVTQQNAALVEQAAAAAESLEEQAQKLSGTMSQFKVDEHSNNVRSDIPKTKSIDSFHLASPQKDSALPRAGAIINRPAATPKFIHQSSNDEWEEF